MSKKIEFVKKDTEKLSDVSQAGLQGLSGGPGIIGIPGEPGEPSEDGILDKQLPEASTTMDADTSDPTTYTWHPKGLGDLAGVSPDDQPNYYQGVQQSRKVAIARGITAIVVDGVGIIVEGTFLPGYKIVDIHDVNDRSIVIERAIRPMR